MLSEQKGSVAAVSPRLPVRASVDPAFGKTRQAQGPAATDKTGRFPYSRFKRTVATTRAREPEKLTFFSTPLRPHSSASW
jgi:hypothetical protein